MTGWRSARRALLAFAQNSFHSVMNMEMRPLGSSAVQVSTISLGAMSFGSGFTRDTWIDEDSQPGWCTVGWTRA